MTTLVNQTLGKSREMYELLWWVLLKGFGESQRVPMQTKKPISNSHVLYLVQV